MQFLLTEPHLALLSALVIEWDDSPPAGAPCVALRAPYGGTTINRMARLMGVEDQGVTRPVRDRAGRLLDHVTEYPSPLLRNMYQFHRETEQALSIVLQLRTWETGTYELSNGRWRRI